MHTFYECSFVILKKKIAQHLFSKSPLHSLVKFSNLHFLQVNKECAVHFLIQYKVFISLHSLTRIKIGM